MPTTLTCRTCGDVYDLPDHLDHAPCRSCGTENCRPQAQGESLEKLNRANRLLRAGEFAEAEDCYKLVLALFDDEHEALWGKLLCQYGVEFVTDPKSGLRHATVHVPHTRPMELHADFHRACELAPAAVRAQYEAEAAYVDAALAEINRRKESSPPYDVFICHKTTRLDGPGYAEDYNRGVQLNRLLERAGYRVFFAPFADLEPGANYEAGIYYALSTAKVMLLISSDAAFLMSPWVRSEWSRYLEMLDDGADKHLIPLMYDRLPDGCMPREIRLRGLQSIRMDSDLDAKDKLLAAMEKHCGGNEKAQAPAQPQTEPAPKMEAAPKTTPECASAPVVNYGPESNFATEKVDGGVAITKYTGNGGVVRIPERLDGMPVVAIGKQAFADCKSLTSVTIPAGVTSVGEAAFWGCSGLTDISIPDGVTGIGAFAFLECIHLESIVLPSGVKEIGRSAFWGCSSLTSIVIPHCVASIGESAFGNCSRLQQVTIPASVVSIGDHAFRDCTSLTSVSIAEGVKHIGYAAFSGNGYLTSLTIPASVTTIGEYAFSAGPYLVLRVYADSAAHIYAWQNGIPFEVLR